MNENEILILQRKPVWTLSLFLAAFLIAPVRLPAQSAVGAPGCGPDNEHFDVKTKKTERPEIKIDPAKALVYFLQDDREFESIPRPVVRMGIDGKWVGATHGNSYFFTTVDPGEHHLCASWQTNVTIGEPKQGGALHFTAEAGQIYVFSVRDRWFREHGSKPLIFEPIDSDQGKLLMNQFALATSKPRKN